MKNLSFETIRPIRSFILKFKGLFIFYIAEIKYFNQIFPLFKNIFFYILP